MFNDEIINEVKSSTDIVDIVAKYVSLKRKGKNYIGLCPFHSEKSPSFCVSPDKQIFYCFGCNTGGDVIRFISKIENLSFNESMNMLANAAGITLPENNFNNKDSKEIHLQERVYEINKIVAEYYHQNLHQQTSKIAQDYIKKRKLDNKALKEFQIGYSGIYDDVYMLLKQKGFSEAEMLESKLVKKYNNDKYTDVFKKKIMFPIKDIQGRVIAFGGRVLDDSKPKYLNTEYNKGKNLYGLYNAKKSCGNEVIIVEGYMDVVSLYQRGITNVVASLGTALTEQQGRLLRRYSKKIIIGYDSDSAGQNATMRGLEILQNLNCDIRILQLDGAKDPDEFILEYGAEYFNKYVSNAISLVEFKIKILKKELNLELTNDKIKFLKEIAKELSKVTNEIEQEVYIEKISKEYKISADAIKAEMYKMNISKNIGIKTLEKRIIVKEPIENKEEIEISDIIKKREKMIIYLLLNFPNQSFKKIKNITIDKIKIEKNKKIIEAVYEELEKDISNINNVLNRLDEDLTNYITKIMAEDFEITEVEKCIQDILVAYEKETLIKERNNIVKKLKNNNGLLDNEVLELEKELNNIILKLAKIK